MRRIMMVSMIGVLVLPWAVFGQTTLSVPALLQEAEHQARVLGNVDAALSYYQRVLDHEAATASQQAQARAEMTNLLVDLGRIEEARVHADWLAKYAPNTPEAAAARAKLAHLSARDPARLMPAETLVYLELVEPGRQLEQILELFQEAGMEDPLQEVLGDLRGDAVANGAEPRSPLGMVFNPALLGELKKIEGLAVGLTQIDDPQTTEDDPEFVSVLLPGQSQAIRGMLQMLLTMGSESVETVGDATVHRMQPKSKESMYAAITPEAILLGTPRALVMDTLDRLAGRTASGEGGAATLADQERFQRQAGARRQDSVILMYADIHGLLTRAKAMIPSHEMHELALLNELADIEAVDDLALRSRLIDGGVAFEMAVSFKAGHPNRMYHLMHTPSADRDLMAYVPADALFCGLMTVGDGESKYDALMAFAKKAVEIGRREAPHEDHEDPEAGVAELETALGIDLQDEVFANIRSFALAVTTPDDEALEFGLGEGDPESAYGLGSLLVLRVKDAEKFDMTLERIATGMAREHLGDVQAQAEITGIALGNASLKRYIIAGFPLVPVVLQQGETFVVTLYEPLAREVFRVAADEAESLASHAMVAETLSMIPPPANKLLVIRPDVAINSAIRMERMKAASIGDDALPLEPMGEVRPMAMYTLENGEGVTLRIEVRDAARLLAQLIEMHHAEHARDHADVAAP